MNSSRMKNGLFVLVMAACLPVSSGAGLVAKYSFEGDTSEGGSWQGTSGNYVPGVSGLAAGFDGVDDILDLGLVYGIGTGDVSVALWARFLNGPPDQQLLSTGDQGASGLIAITYANSGSQLIRLVTQEIVNGIPASDNLYTNDDYGQGEWIHIVVTRSGSSGSIYIDGELQNTETDLRPGDLGSGSWRLGLGHQSSYFEGEIDELMIFDHALDQDDVDDILQPNRATASLKVIEAPGAPGEVIAIAKGLFVDPPAGEAVTFNATFDCAGFTSSHSCTIDSITNTIVKATTDGVVMKCVYETGAVSTARIRLKTKNTVLEGDLCMTTLAAQSDSGILLDAEATAVLNQ